MPPPPPAPPADAEDRTVVPIGAAKRQAKSTGQEKPKEKRKPTTVTSLSTGVTTSAERFWMQDLVCDEDGNPKKTAAANWALFLENEPETKGLFAFDNFRQSIVVTQAAPWEKIEQPKARPSRDIDYTEATIWLEKRYLTPTTTKIVPIVNMVAEHNGYDPLIDYLEGLKWDGKSRVETWLTYYLGVDDTAYARAVGLRWLISSVARAMVPGCKCDTMPILEGEQGLRKSTAVRALYGSDFFTDELSDIGSKDASMELQGVWGLEVAEMHRFSASETSAVKKFLSKQEDRYRPPYGKTVIRVPRRVILVGTINPDGNGYLRDTTGGRRFWPVRVGARIDIDGLATDRDQLWAEAVTLWRNGVLWWMQDEDAAVVHAEQEKRSDVDVWVEHIEPALRGRATMPLREILTVLEIKPREADWRHSMRIGRIMARLGWVQERKGDRTVFRLPGSAPTMADDPQEW
jgi:predicted P-loop ATPase